MHSATNHCLMTCMASHSPRSTASSHQYLLVSLSHSLPSFSSMQQNTCSSGSNSQQQHSTDHWCCMRVVILPHPNNTHHHCRCTNQCITPMYIADVLEILLSFSLLIHGIKDGLALGLVALPQLVNLPLHLLVQRGHALV